MVILQKEKNTITVSQEIGSREISSGLDKMKSLQDMISENPSLLSEFISENLDMFFDFEELKSYRINQNNSQINNLKALYKINVKPIVDFFVGNLELTSKKNGFEGSSIEYLEISDFNITKTMQKTSGNSSHSFVGNRKGYSTKVEIETVYFKVNVKNIKFNSEFEKNIPEYILENFYKVLLGYLRNHNLYGHLIKKIDSDDSVLLENIDKINNQKVFESTVREIKNFVNDILYQSTRFQTKMISVIYDFDDKGFKILDSDNTKNYKNRMFFGHIGNHERHKAQFVNALFDEVEMEIFADKLYNDFIKLAENKISKTLTSKKMMSLSEVVKKNIPVNLLSDQQILESLRSTQSLLDIAQIKDSIADEKQWARVLNIIDSYLNSII